MNSKLTLFDKPHIPGLGEINIELSGTLTSICEKCDGEGEITEEREARIDELTDTQFKFLLEAEMFRENGDAGDDDEFDDPFNDSGDPFSNPPGMPSGGQMPSGGKNLPGSRPAGF